MHFEIDSSLPIYLQIIKNIKRQIIVGELKPGDEIPSRREMASNLKINLNTVQKAYKEMGDMKLITTFGNHQSRITSNKEIINSLRTEMISESLKKFMTDMKAIDVDKKELLSLIEKFY
ncbi:GntR family transcriptional regulator [Peptacetobacter sp.]|uniref:GntR family transcriptional regulator n=1 Tax=Peptacetobacter sp. TaxID=2991975 RepID=UPI0026331EDB|nr:GntR family transcriptional regulator [Peptacetobacter sp.]